MKTGRVAKMFGRDPKTIMKWADTFPDFFTPEARGEGGEQREFNHMDLIALNTIKYLMGQREDQQTINVKMEAGYRETSLPPEFASLESDKALAVYAEMGSLKAENSTLKEQLRGKDEIIDKKDNEIARLNREIGKWQAMYDMLKEQNEDGDSK
jgi:DNA-binding transcriptional MerR regulator